jgi:hypothetical protein
MLDSISRAVMFGGAMKPAAPLKLFLSAFGIAVLVYFSAFYGIEHRRTANGPWRVTFASDGGASPPCLIVDEPKLNITALKITFPGQTAPATNAVMVFDQPREVPFAVPFGNCVFMDAISLPGTVAFNMFGHEIQLLPRVLTIDKQEHPWQSNTTLEAGK